MATATKNLYEIMFLVSQGTAAMFGELLDHINRLFERSEMEVVAMQKWDERRLAYEIEKQKRGVYLLAYVRADPESVSGFERDCNLSDTIMRVLVLRADHLTEEEAAAYDQRDELRTEAKMRAEAAPLEEEQSRTAAVLGAPGQDDAEEQSEGYEDSED